MTPASQNIVVSDASPIISLERIPNGHELLHLFFAKVIVPEPVMTEIYLKFYPSPEIYLKTYSITDLN